MNVKKQNFWIPLVIVAVVAAGIALGSKGDLFRGLFSPNPFNVLTAGRLSQYRDCSAAEINVRVSPSTPTGSIDVSKYKEMVGTWVMTTPSDCQVNISSMLVTWVPSNFAREKFHVNLKNVYATPSSGWAYRFANSGATCVNNALGQSLLLSPVAGPIYVRGSEGIAVWSGFSLDQGIGAAGTEPRYRAFLQINDGIPLGVSSDRGFVSAGAPVNVAAVQDTCR